MKSRRFLLQRLSKNIITSYEVSHSHHDTLFRSSLSEKVRMADTKASSVEEFFSYLYRSINIPRRIVWNGDDKEILEGWNRYFDEDLGGGLGESVNKTAILHQNISAMRSEHGSETTIGIPYTVPLARNLYITLPQNHLLFFTSLFNPFCLGFIHPRYLRMENLWWTHSQVNGIPFMTCEPIPTFESQTSRRWDCFYSSIHPKLCFD